MSDRCIHPEEGSTARIVAAQHLQAKKMRSSGSGKLHFNQPEHGGKATETNAELTPESRGR
jgi:hypothetical protein